MLSVFRDIFGQLQFWKAMQNTINRKSTMQNLLNMPAYNAIKKKLENPSLGLGFRNELLMASKALEKTLMFVDNQVKYLAGDFMGPFVVGANNGYDNVRAASLRKKINGCTIFFLNALNKAW